MALSDELKFKLWNDVTAVSSLIERWMPEGCKTEKEFEKSLLAFLRQEMPTLEITSQFAFGKQKADIVIDKKVIIEIKTNLKSVSACHRLVGQLNDYCDWKGRIILVLTGDTDHDLKFKLEKYAKDANDKHGNPLSVFVDHKMLIIQK